MKSNGERVMTIHYSGIKKEETSNPSDYLDLLGLLGDAAHVRAHIYHKKYYQTASLISFLFT